ncbi:MAG: DNA topoisomerase IB [Planctomycetaceae bacterium]
MAKRKPGGRRAKRGTHAAPHVSARSASLRYVSDQTAGIRRVRSGKGFRYLRPNGKSIRDRATLARIQRLVIPPAWEEVWICPLAEGHIQAVGRDARGRKQYRYHPRWSEYRDEAKYSRLAQFATSLTEIRRRVRADLRRKGLPKEKALATIVQLLESTLIRVGNEEYARVNGSFGLTTLKNRHVRVRGSQIRFRFRGKGGIEHTVELSDKRVARLVKKFQELPGQNLFQYSDEAGTPRDITSSDLNDYLRDVSRSDFTAKDFRTWAGTLFAAQLLCDACGENTPDVSETERKRTVSAVIRNVAAQLGNTVAVCRKCYVHPAVIDAYLRGNLNKSLLRGGRGGGNGRKVLERSLILFLMKGASTSSSKRRVA